MEREQNKEATIIISTSPSTSTDCLAAVRKSLPRSTHAADGAGKDRADSSGPHNERMLNVQRSTTQHTRIMFTLKTLETFEILEILETLETIETLETLHSGSRIQGVKTRAKFLN